MKNHLNLFMILAICFMKISASAQETASQKKGKIEFGIGMNFFGPKLHMANLMEKHGFDDEAQSWLSSIGSSPPNPHYSKVGFTALISYSYSITLRSQLGILLNYSNLVEVSGFSNYNGYLSVKFTNISLVPVYKLKLKEKGEFQAGPALMINKGKRTTNEGNGNPENYTKLSIGLLTGLAAQIWDGKDTYGKIGAYTLLTYGNNMGPYTSSSSMNTKTIPESKMNFSHLNIIFAVGF